MTLIWAIFTSLLARPAEAAITYDGRRLASPLALRAALHARRFDDYRRHDARVFHGDIIGRHARQNTEPVARHIAPARLYSAADNASLPK